MGHFLQSIDGVVEEIMRIHRSLPARPSLDEVEAAMALIRNVDKEEQFRIDTIAKQKKSPNVPEELFFVLQEMQKNLVFFQSKEQKREALKLLDLENAHALFDEFLQRASKCVPSSENYNPVSDYSSSSAASTVSGTVSLFSSTAASSSAGGSDSFTVLSGSYSEKEIRRSCELFAKDDSYLKKPKGNLYVDGIGVGVDSFQGASFNSPIKYAASSGDGEKLSLIQFASLIEVSSKKGNCDIHLQNRLMDQIEWVPDSIGKLSGLISLDLSENRITTLPHTIGGLSSLTKLDLHSNRISELPDSIGDLFSLVFMHLRGNQLSMLPSTIGKLSRLAELDLSSNQLSSLPDSIGNLVNLKILNIETNDIEELPHSIGRCTCLIELHADYNRLKALPEAIGRLESLEILSVRYNNIKALPTTMSSMSKLKEIDVSFNELEMVPESLCLATTIVKMNLGNNFADLQSLPRSLGNLEMLEELDISNNQIRMLPESFGMLSKLRILRIQENPLEMPPRYIAEKGAEAVVQYMAEHVAKRDMKVQPTKAKKTWAPLCFFSRSRKRKLEGVNYVAA